MSTALPARPVPEARLLVVDDEPNIRELLSASLRFAGFEVATAADGVEALNRARELSPELIVLDVMMPGLDGFAVAETLRRRGDDVPLLFLTARDATEDRVQGLVLGADDYVTKPFSLEEVVARIRSILRRTAAGAAGSASAGVVGSAVPAPSSRLTYADLVLDPDTHEVFEGDRYVELTRTEFDLLRCFLQNPGRVLSKSQLLQAVWGYDFGGDGNVVESYVSYLRKKVDTSEPKLLQTVRGVGYVLREPRTGTAGGVPGRS